LLLFIFLHALTIPKPIAHHSSKQRHDPYSQLTINFLCVRVKTIEETGSAGFEWECGERGGVGRGGCLGRTTGIVAFLFVQILQYVQQETDNQEVTPSKRVCPLRPWDQHTTPLSTVTYHRLFTEALLTGHHNILHIFQDFLCGLQCLK
jgi:hypothetical protein